MTRRLAATASLLLFAAAVALAVDAAVNSFPHGLTVLACVAAAGAAAWWGVLRGGLALAVALGIALALVAGAVVLVVSEDSPLQNALVIVTFLLSLAAARAAFSPHLAWPEVRPPERPVLFYNPKSGGGKAERFHVADEARARGIEPVELRPGEDLAKLVDQAIAGGADALAMAGGDGSQAVVAAKAAEHGLPYACIPSGTRNHFALDLGVDREDVVGALDAFVDGRERTVDLAEVNGRVFVNNVSLGVYAEAVQRGGYRAAKLRTLARTAPEVLGRNGGGLDLRWIGPDGRERRSGAVLLVSNDPYRLGRALGSGTRPSLERGMLGIAAFGSGNGRVARHRGVGQWASESFEVTSGSPVAAGIDGEAVRLDPPLRFRALPAALRVRIAPQHPGGSPSALMPASPWRTIEALARVAAGQPPAR
jgi:diacylglycerol kinase family enzyme